MNAGDVVYAIPSRARADVLVAKTLPLLERLGVHPTRIRLYIDRSEWSDYRRAILARWPSLDPLKYGAVVNGGLETGPPFDLRRGRLGMAAQRHAILDDLPAGVPVIQLDDDLRDLLIRRDEKTLEPIDPDEWRDIVRTLFGPSPSLAGYEPSLATPPRLWGLYPVPNPYFMQPRVRIGLSYIGGGLFGYWNDPAPDSPLRVSLEDKEDFERSLATYAAGWDLLRADYVTWRTQGYRGAGGMQADGERTDERIDRSARELAARYPHLATVNTTKRSGKTELRLKDRRR